MALTLLMRAFQKEYALASKCICSWRLVDATRCRIPTSDTIVWISAVRETEDHPLKAIVLFSCVGLIGSLCLTMFGIDLGAGWI